jgi:hypothetical protein
MAKRKRASLKDKSPETLGLTQKKGKGMDLLFGGRPLNLLQVNNPGLTAALWMSWAYLLPWKPLLMI